MFCIGKFAWPVTESILFTSASREACQPCTDLTALVVYRDLSPLLWAIALTGPLTFP